MKYLKPLDFYEEIFKEILKKKDYLKPGRLLGLDVSDKYVSLAVSDWKNLTAVPLRALDRQENNLSSMLADIFQSLIPEHNIVGFVVGTKNNSPIDAQTLIFIDDLCNTGKFEGLKYTLWDCEITSKNAEFVFKQNLKFILENLPRPQFQLEHQLQPQPQSQPQPDPHFMTIMDKGYAVCALQGYLDITNKMVEEDWV